MKKSIMALIGVAAIVVIAGAVLLVTNSKSDDSQSSSPKTSTTNASSDDFKVVKACDVLTASVAQQLAGADASTDSSAANAGASSESIDVSNCNYYSTSSKLSVGLLARSAKDKTGADSNKYQFESGLPSDAQKVSGYGQAAYWSPTYGQFNILKSNNWYILTNGPIKPAERTLDQAKQYANLIINKL